MRDAAADEVADRGASASAAKRRYACWSFIAVIFQSAGHRLRHGVAAGAIALRREPAGRCRTTRRACPSSGSRAPAPGSDCTRDHTSSAGCRPGRDCHAAPLRAGRCSSMRCVETGVVRDVAAAAQDRQHRPRQTRRQFARDDVERRRSAGGQDDRRARRTGARRRTRARHPCTRCISAADHRRVARRIAGDLQPLVALEAGQRDACARGDRRAPAPALRRGCGSRCARPARRARAAQSACATSCSAARRGFDRRQLRQRIDQEVELEIRMRFTQPDHRRRLRLRRAAGWP